MSIIERIEIGDLAAINRALRKSGLTVKMTEVQDNMVLLKVTALPTPPAKPEAPQLPFDHNEPEGLGRDEVPQL